jgi:isopentenyl phosphate kinase
MKELVFIKLGGSLITDKTKPYTPLLDVIDTLAAQIAYTIQTQPNLRLIIGHGAGSFGHVAASEYKTRDGYPRPSPLIHRDRDLGEENYWRGFAEVWYQASALNRYVMDALHKAGVRAIALPPSSSVIASDGKVAVWETTPISMALAAGIVPVVFGDVVFDEIRGGTILSTENLFAYLVKAFDPERILLAGLEGAVWEDFPARTRRIERITPQSFEAIQQGIGKSTAADVTGGMEAKVKEMLELAQENPGLKIQIFSGTEPGNISRALMGERIGTEISAL